MSDRHGPTSLIIGRENELAALRADLAASMQGMGRLVLLEGEAGIGKTTLATAHGAEATARGALVLWGRCQDVPGAPAYWPWIQVLEGLQRAGVPGYDGDVETIQSLVPELRDAAGSGARSVDEQSQFELFARIADMLARLSEKQGLVIVIDDLHSADASSRHLLRFLAAELSRAAIFFVATLRDHEPTTQTVRDDFARLARHVPVGPLEVSSIQRLLAERLLDTNASQDLTKSNAFAQELWERSNGNPFFVLEIAQLLMTQNQDRGERPILPTGVKVVLENRLRPLGNLARSVLQAAAAIGRKFDMTRLARATQRDAGPLNDILDSAISLGLIVKTTGAPDHFEFVHALTRETLYDSLGRREASTLHARIGEAIEIEFAENPRDLQLAELAHHFFEAVEAIGSEKFVDYALKAGHRALDQFAYDEAAQYFERVVKALEPSSHLEDYIRAQVALSQALLGMGERERAEVLAREARDGARTRGFLDVFGEALLCWSAAREEIGVIDTETNDAIEAALPLLEESDTAIRARLMARLSSGLYCVPGSQEKQQLLNDRAAELARQTGKPSVIGFVQLRRMTTLLGPDHIDERLQLIDEMLNEAGDLPIPALHALTFLVDARAELCDRPGLDLALSRFHQKAERLRHPYFLWTADSFRAAMALLEGHYEEAEASAQSALAWGIRAQQKTPGLHFAQQMFMLRGCQNRWAEIAPLVEGSAKTTQVIPAWRCALADLYCRLERFDEARVEFEALAVDDFVSLPNDTTWMTSLVLISNVCCQLGDRERAETLYRLLEPFSGQVCITTPLILLVHTIDSRLGLLATLLERYADAEMHFTRALKQADHMRAPTWKAEILFHLAELLRKRNEAGDPERAQQAVVQSESIARSVGMELLLAWIAKFRDDSKKAVGQRAPEASEPMTGRFIRDGAVWSLGLGRHTMRFGSLAGLGHLHRLLSAPGTEIHALDLVGPGHSAAVLGDSGEVIDEKSRGQYQARLRDLDEDIETAEQMNDRGNHERLIEEREMLVSELSRGFGIGGRPRRVGSASERARVSVTRAIKYSIRKIAEHDAALAAILDRDVKTGTYCSYAPVDRDRIRWTI